MKNGNQPIISRESISSKDILLVTLLVMFSLLHKANRYSFILFNYTFFLYIAVWIVCLLFILSVLNLVTRWRTNYSGFVIYSGFFLLNFGEIQDFILHIFKSRLVASTWMLVTCFILFSIVE